MLEMSLNDYINNLTHKQLQYLHSFEILNFACEGDRRKTQALRNGLRKFINSIYGKAHNYDVEKLKSILKNT